MRMICEHPADCSYALSLFPSLIAYSIEFCLTTIVQSQLYDKKLF